jgi:hypothetical protein
MAINRLAISNASANTDTVLYTAVRNCLTSVIATNKSNSQSLVRIWIVPAGQSGDSTKWMHIAYDSIVTGNNSLETFRFPLENGDLVYVRADSANISFSISGIYENSGTQKVYYDSTAPGAPSIGDIWVNSGSSYANTNTSAVIAYQSAEPTTKSPNLLWVDSSGNNTVYANQTGVTGNWSISGSANIGKSSFGVDNGSVIELGSLQTSDSFSYIDFHSTLGTDFESRIIQDPGINGPFTLVGRGTGGMYIKTQNNAGGTGGPLFFFTADSERMRIDSSGNVGIGANSPSYKVDIQDSTTATWYGLRILSAAPVTQAYTGISLEKGPGYGGIVAGYLHQSTGSGLQILTNNGGTVTEVARAISNGSSFLIGYTTTNNTAYRLQVNSQIFATSSTVATSDGRYKENVNTISGGLDIIDSLRPVSFDWKQHAIHNFPEGKTIGFIAQEVKESLQDYEWVDNLVKTNYNEETEEEFLGIAEGNIIPLLVSAIKELRAEVNSLKEQLNG